VNLSADASYTRSKTLDLLVQEGPLSLKALLNIKGMGKTKVAQFGKDIVNICQHYRTGDEEIVVDTPALSEEQTVPPSLLTSHPVNYIYQLPPPPLPKRSLFFLFF
jgi:hypothetical protein